jgi:6-phosphogluconolactonase (cycloisomerase 2 family)
MSVDQNGALNEVIQDFEYWDDSDVHGSAFNKDNTIADTLGNAIWAQKIDAQTGKLKRTSAIVSGPSDHADPHHIVVHTSGNALYAVMEGSNEMGWYEIDNRTQIPLLRSLFPL